MSSARIVALVCATASGCATASFSDRFPDEPQEPEALAVARFSFDRDDGIAAGAEDGCVEAINDRGLRAIDRHEVAGVADGPRYYQRIGKATGAGAVIAGSLPATARRKGHITVRLVSTKTGEVLSTAEYRGRLEKSYKLGLKVCRDLLDEAGL